MKIPEFKFQNENARERFEHLQPMLRDVILPDMHSWCATENVPFLITCTVSTPEEDILLERTSKTHVEGRAADLSRQSWPQDKIDKFQLVFNEKYKDVAAISAETGKPLLILQHNNGNGFHFHVQIRRLEV